VRQTVTMPVEGRAGDRPFQRMFGLKVEHVTSGDPTPRPVEERLLRGQREGAPPGGAIDHAVEGSEHLVDRRFVTELDRLELLVERGRGLFFRPASTGIDALDAQAVAVRLADEVARRRPERSEDRFLVAVGLCFRTKV